jgi:hypothetical protein
MFPSKNGLLQGDALSPLLFSFAVVYVIRGVQVNQDRLKLNGIHQVLVYADDVNMLNRNVGVIKKNREPLVATSKEIRMPDEVIIE